MARVWLWWCTIDAQFANCPTSDSSNEKVSIFVFPITWVCSTL
jgi:hypothetical protein